MKKLFYAGLLLLLIFELMNVYFIMPMPGSQRMNSINVAYYLYKWRWIFRVFFAVCLIIGAIAGKWRRRWPAFFSILIIGLIIYFLNFRMSADHMFHQPGHLVFKHGVDNKVDTGRLVLGVVIGGIAKAYPIQFLGYHHLVSDKFDSTPVLLTYCTVCRTGRAYKQVVQGRTEKFRLVGMDHFNAMMEDAATGSWWRQATGEAITGKLKGKRLNEVYSSQVSLGEWLRLYPGALVMQEDTSYADNYAKGFEYEDGSSKSSLTGTDTMSWGDKSWVVGLLYGDSARAYDWKVLKTRRIIEDHFAGCRMIIVLGEDGKSFFAYRIPVGEQLNMQGDDIQVGIRSYRINGEGKNTSANLEKVAVYQEFWHSWKTFHPRTSIYKN